MSENKVFSINPDLFTFKNTGNTRKKEKSKPREKIKIRNEQQLPKNESLRKKSILKMIRDHHSEKNKDRFSHIENKITSQPKVQGDFEKATTFFNNMVVTNNKPHNATLKNNISTSNQTESSIAPKLTLGESVKLDFQNNLQEHPITLNNSPIPTPKYGCLKNGNLPTYRSLFNTTRKNNYPDIQGPDNQNTIVNHKRNEILNKLNKKTNYGDIYRKNKQKRTIRRTFNTGKSMKIPKVSVLVTNKTIRNNTTLRIMKIKEKPINEIKRELVKRGLIKVGTITPNDVLRQMYETVEMICGDVQNHNSKNLLYNFINDN